MLREGRWGERGVWGVEQKPLAGCLLALLGAKGLPLVQRLAPGRARPPPSPLSNLIWS